MTQSLTHTVFTFHLFISDRNMYVGKSLSRVFNILECIVKLLCLS